MLWIALHLPQLPLDTALRSRHNPESDAHTAPLAIAEHKRIGWYDRQAGESGIRAGMSESNARAMAADLQIVVRNAQAETQALHEAALWALHFTPHVTLRPCGLLMEIAASLRLFGGCERIAAKLLDGVNALGLQAGLAFAHTATGAWLHAQCPQTGTADAGKADALDRLPVRTLEHAAPHLDTLNDIGCHTIGQLRRLPRGGVTRRFGRQLLGELDRAYGQEAEAHVWFEAPTVFRAALELPSRIEHAESLLFAARRLLLQLTGWLTARHAAVAGITLWLHHESRRRRDHRSTPLPILLGMASRDPEHLTLLLRERLARLTLIAPVIELSLEADRIVEQAAANTELFPTPASQAETTGRLIERLQSRLGVHAVRQLALFDDHRPERSVITPTLTSAPRRGGQSSQPRHATARPAWLLPRPLPLSTQGHKPFYQSPLTLLSGPERIETGWWDDKPATRDYFIAQNEAHCLLWIFRARVPKEAESGGWFLHGLFG